MKREGPECKNKNKTKSNESPKPTSDQDSETKGDSTKSSSKGPLRGPWQFQPLPRSVLETTTINEVEKLSFEFVLKIDFKKKLMIPITTKDRDLLTAPIKLFVTVEFS